MIKDIVLIRKHLMDFAEVEMPYDLDKNCHIQYITNQIVDDIESEYFYTGGKFIRRCNDILILEINGNEKFIPIWKRDKYGTIIYKSRFFIKEGGDDGEDGDDGEGGESNNILIGGGKTGKETEIIKYQQSIIDKLTEKVKDVEIEKMELNETIKTYEDLLQDGRFKLKELSIELRDKTKKIEHYEELIPKLYSSIK